MRSRRAANAISDIILKPLVIAALHPDGVRAVSSVVSDDSSSVAAVTSSVVTPSASVSVSVSGDGELIGLENGDQTDVTSYTESWRKTTCGQMIAFVRRTGNGAIQLEASCDGVGRSALEF